MDDDLAPTSPVGIVPTHPPNFESFQWTAAGQDTVKHLKLIAVGGYGAVHQVLGFFYLINCRWFIYARIMCVSTFVLFMCRNSRGRLFDLMDQLQ